MKTILRAVFIAIFAKSLAGHIFLYNPQSQRVEENGNDLLLKGSLEDNDTFLGEILHFLVLLQTSVGLAKIYCRHYSFN